MEFFLNRIFIFLFLILQSILPLCTSLEHSMAQGSQSDRLPAPCRKFQFLAIFTVKS